MLMPSAFSAQIPKIRYADEGSDQVSKIRFTIPDYCKEFTNDNDIYFSLVREYKDCIIIQKSLKKGDDQNQYFSFDVDFLTGKAGKTSWVRLDKSMGSRDRIYNVYPLADKTVVIALSTTKIPYVRNEKIVTDEILKAKTTNKTIIIRYFGPGYLYQSENTGHKTVIPSTAELVSANVLRLQYQDGAVENWRIKPSAEYMKKNKEKFGQPLLGQPDRLLIWWNGVGKGTPGADHDLSKAWDFAPDTSKEPKYEDRLASDFGRLAASDKKRMSFGGEKTKVLFARAARSVKCFFASLLSLLEA
jgi:hypothetical protein